MIGRLFRWNPLVLPPLWLVAAVWTVYLFFEMLHVSLIGWRSYWEGGVVEFVRLRVGIVGFTAAFFALIRFRFHPAYRVNYCEWLEYMPWTADKPLPLGPVHLIPQDFCILGVLLLLTRSSGMELIWVPFAYLFAYEFAMAFTLFRVNERWAAYQLLAGLSIAIAYLHVGIFGLFVLVVVYPMAYLAHMRCLSRFPWREGAPLFTAGAFRFPAGLERRSLVERHQLGFPYEYLAPKQNVPAISRSEALAISLLALAWSHAFLVNVPDSPEQLGLPCFICFLAATLLRLILYCGNYWPPISILGRIATGRFLIWRYDRVFFAPLLASLVLTAIFPITMTRAGVVWGMPLLLSLSLWINLSLGPKLLDWRLTGAHRLGLGFRDRKSFVEP